LIPTLFERGKKMLVRIKTLETQLNKMDKLLLSFEEKYLQKEVENSKKND
jgi:hypothetical protein